ncbi:MAG TPA: hypothetical protein DIU07_09325 [Rhodobacteraceae bacterium]|nr:hypothetical protein [Paracoccaceae bacterium]
MTRAARPGPPALDISALLAALMALALAGPAAAEGNRLALACEALAPVPADEAIAEEAAPLPRQPTFTIAPLRTARDGSGTVEATGPDGRTNAGVTASHTGPFAWTSGTVLNTLTVEGATEDGRTLVLWHQLDQAQAQVPPVGQLTKLICEIS